MKRANLRYRGRGGKNAALLLALVILLVDLSGCHGKNVERRASSGWPEGARAAVSLTFDDARPSQVELGVPLFDEYGVKATFYVLPKRVDKRLSAWKEAVANGHEIGNHTRQHPCSGNFNWAREKALEDYTLARMAEELETANVEIELLLGIRPATYAYTCGQKFVGRGVNLQSYVPLVAEMFVAGRGWKDEGSNDLSFCDPAQLMAMELDELDFASAKVLIDEAVRDGKWLIFAGHEVGEGGKKTVRLDTLRAICEYAADPANGIWIDTVENVARHVRRLQAQARSTSPADDHAGPAGVDSDSSYF